MGAAEEGESVPAVGRGTTETEAENVTGTMNIQESDPEAASVNTETVAGRMGKAIEPRADLIIITIA